MSHVIQFGGESWKLIGQPSCPQCGRVIDNLEHVDYPPSSPVTGFDTVAVPCGHYAPLSEGMRWTYLKLAEQGGIAD